MSDPVAIVVSWCLGGVVVWWRGCGDEAVLDPVVIVSWWCGGVVVRLCRIPWSWCRGIMVVWKLLAWRKLGVWA